MKVKQLIEFLKNEDKDAEVGFSYNYGDHGNTHVVADIHSCEEMETTFSEYHRMGRVIEDGEMDEDEDEDEDEEGRPTVKRMVILS